jgi:hypothetical protein
VVVLGGTLAALADDAVLVGAATTILDAVVADPTTIPSRVDEETA